MTAPVSREHSAPDQRRSVATIAVVIVNYGTPDLTIDCLASLKDELSTFPGSRAFVADNASPDNSVARVSRAIESNGWSDWAKVIPLPRNGGFAYGNNAVIRPLLEDETPPEYVWLLNSDTIVRPGALRALAAFLDEHDSAAIAGSCLEDPDGTQQCSAFRFHTVSSEFLEGAQLGFLSRWLSNCAVAPPAERKLSQFDWVSGASMMIRTRALREIGLLDERYFLYFEETDYCQMVKRAGWGCWFVPESRVIHLVGKSTGLTARDRGRARRSAYWFQSRRRYFVTHHGRVYAVLSDVALAAGTLLSNLRSLIRLQPSKAPKRFFSDLLRNSALFNKTKTGPTA